MNRSSGNRRTSGRSAALILTAMFATPLVTGCGSSGEAPASPASAAPVVVPSSAPATSTPVDPVHVTATPVPAMVVRPALRCPDGTHRGIANRGTWSADACFDGSGKEVPPITISYEEWEALVAAHDPKVFP